MTAAVRKKNEELTINLKCITQVSDLDFKPFEHTL